MKRWNCKKGEHVENTLIDSFLEEIISVCKKHKFSISHEDHHGAFEIEIYDEARTKWLLGAAEKID